MSLKETRLRPHVGQRGLSIHHTRTLSLSHTHNTHTNNALSPGDFKEGKSKEIRLDTISSKILERVVEYFTYKAKFKKATGGSTPSFDVKPEEALEVMAAANYLDC